MISQEYILDQLRTLKPELQEQCGVQELALFGSFARGEAREDSDIDIFVVLEKPRFEWLVGVQIAIERALNMRVDIVRDGAYLRESFRATIQKEALYV